MAQGRPELLLTVTNTDHLPACAAGWPSETSRAALAQFGARAGICTGAVVAGAAAGVEGAEVVVPAVLGVRPHPVKAVAKAVTANASAGRPRLCRPCSPG